MNRSNGFTLVEVLVVISILALLAPLGMPDLRYKVQQTKINSLATETGILSIAAVNSFDDNAVWPGGASCANAITALTAASPPYISDVDGTNVFNSSVTTSCTLNEFVITQNVNPSFIQEAVQTLGGTSIIDAAAGTIRTTIPRPGNSAGNDDLLPRDGSRWMLADLNMNANDIVGVTNVSATGTLSGDSLSVTNAVVGSNISSASLTTDTANVSTSLYAPIVRDDGGYHDDSSGTSNKNVVVTNRTLVRQILSGLDAINLNYLNSRLSSVRPSVVATNGGRGRGNHALGYYHACSSSGHYNNGGSGDRINAYIYASSGPISDGRRYWRLNNYSERSSQQLRFTCWYFR